MSDGLEPTITLEHPVALPSVAAAGVEASAAYSFFCDASNSNKLSAKRRDGSTASYEGFVSDVQDIGKGEVRWTQDNGADVGMFLARAYPNESVSGVPVPPFAISTAAYTNTSGARRNQVFSMGWNMGAGGGGPLIAGETAIGIGFESFYSPDATTNDFMEYHIYAVTNTGGQRRPYSTTLNRTTNELINLMSGDLMYFQKNAGGLQTVIVRQQGALDDDDRTWTFGRFNQLKVKLQNEYNNISALEQMNAAGGAYVEICRVDNNSRVVIDSGAAGTKLGGTVGFNNATPIAKPTITGSRAGNAALASLLTQLAAYGLITDGTTA